MRPLTFSAPRRGAGGVPKSRTAGGGEIVKATAFGLVTLMLLTALVALAPMSRADHIFEGAVVDPPISILPAPAGNRIGLLGPCFFGISDIGFPADTGFFVAHGWNFAPWEDTSAADKHAAASRATVFELSIDGVIQRADLHAAMIPGTPDGQVFVKLWVTEYHEGLSGTHLFVGRWYIDASISSIGGQFGVPVLDQECSLTVHFVP